LPHRFRDVDHVVLVNNERIRVSLRLQLLSGSDIYLLDEYFLETDLGGIGKLRKAAAAFAFDQDVRLASDQDAVRRA